MRVGIACIGRLREQPQHHGQAHAEAVGRARRRVAALGPAEAIDGDAVRTAAARSFYGLREKHDFGLLVTTLDQLTGLSYDIVIMCGMVDGEFPST